MSGANQYHAQTFIDAIPGSGGIISTIAKRVGCAWHTAKKYCAEYATVAKAYRDECESITDLAESTVLKAIRDGDVSAAKWYLTMKAKDRGYAERQIVDVTTKGESLNVAHTDDERARAMVSILAAFREELLQPGGNGHGTLDTPERATGRSGMVSS